MKKAKTDADLERLAALGEPLRRGLYDFVAGQAEPVSRDQAAAALGIPRAVAAFHLDRLVREQLLEAGFARLGGRTGPGAGRPSKLYSRSVREFEVTLPPRRYELAAGLLAEVAATAPADELIRVAESHGRDLGAGFRNGSRGPRARLEAVLRDAGYEPLHGSDGSIRLRNCPFDAIARRFPDLVCGMNLALMRGLVAGLGGSAVQPVLDPAPDRCCVAFHQAEPGHEGVGGDGAGGRDRDGSVPESPPSGG